MPFKIIQTYNEQQDKQELCICPSKWEKHGVLHWPKKKSKKLCKIEDSTPQPNWIEMKCIVKRKNIISYEIADKLLTEMLDCSTTEQEGIEPLPAPSPQLIGLTNQLENFNIKAQQALNRDAATVSNPPEQIQIQETLYAVAVDEPISVVTVDNETTSVPVEAIEPTGFEQITSNQVEIYKNQEAILNDLALLKDDNKKVLDNQQSILMAIAHISVKLDTFITGKYEPQVTKLNDALKKTPDNNRFCLKPIRNIEELSNLEAILNDGKMKEDYKIKYSIVCQPGKAENCAYQLVDVFFAREFLTKCSWSGSARGEGTKVCLKQYKNVLQLFFELIYECDHTYTIAGNEKFFKSVLKNATKRKNSKLQRSSTCRNSHKRQKLSKNAVNNNESSEEGTSNEAQNLVNEANEENRENIPQEEKTSQEENAQILDSVAIEDNVSQDNHVPELPEQQIVSGQENDLKDTV